MFSLAFSFFDTQCSTKRSTKGTQACRRCFRGSSVIPELAAVVRADAQRAHRTVFRESLLPFARLLLLKPLTRERQRPTVLGDDLDDALRCTVRNPCVDLERDAHVGAAQASRDARRLLLRCGWHRDRRARRPAARCRGSVSGPPQAGHLAASRVRLPR
jgi:hypothetical protein